MKTVIILLLSSLLFSGELEVDGDLIVKGTDVIAKIDSLNQVIAELQAQLAAMQADNKLETRVYDMYLSWEQNAQEFTIDLEEITGYNLENAIVNFYSLQEHEFAGDGLEFEVYIQEEGYTHLLALSRTLNGVLLDRSGDTNFIYSNFLNYTLRVLQDYQTAGNATIKFAVTAQFPN